MVAQPQMQVQTQGPDGKRLCAWSHWKRGAKGLLTGWLLASAAACGVNEDGTLPPDVANPKDVETAAGARGLFAEVEVQFEKAFEQVVMVSGLMTDELAALPITVGTTVPSTSLDSRQRLSFKPNRLHRLRAQARQARQYLSAFAPDSIRLRAVMYAREGYAELFLADLFCSGIPLSTVNFEGDYTLATGSTTSEVYRHALALFDTASALALEAEGNTALQALYLAALGRGRALLALGRYAEAAGAVGGVPDNARQAVPVTWMNDNSSTAPFASSTTSPPDSLVLGWYWGRPTSSTQNNRRIGAPSVADQEGGNGLNYRTSGDPRVQTMTKGSDPATRPLLVPVKAGPINSSATSPASSITLAMPLGIEARLIEAEAALAAGDVAAWLTKLNQPRQTACNTIVPATTCPLANLDDPGAALSDPTAANAARVDLLFRERAFWLYLTGTRQGDLRRLVRNYTRTPETVYPMGGYPGGTGEYGSEYVIPIPADEQRLNHLYTGCFNLNA